MSNSSIVYHHEAMEHNENKDRLSSLPDDILLSILQLIDIDEATRSSILSRRWRYLAPYSYFTSLDLDANKKKSLVGYKNRPISYKDGKPKFVNWVNQLVTLHRAPFLNDFRVCFPLLESDSDCLCMWIRFALSKGVKKLELVFCSSGGFDYSGSLPLTPRCSFPSNVFKVDNNNNNVFSNNLLTSLCLRFVNISGELLELVLSRSHLLERLYIEGSNDLVNLKINNTSEKLKQLSIYRCNFLQEIEIHAVNLVSFELSHSHKDLVRFRPDSVNVVYASVPSLVDARFYWLDYYTFFPYFSQMHGFAAQLTKLSLEMNMRVSREPNLPSFSNVKSLELRVTFGHHSFDWRHMNPLRLRRYVKPCPILEYIKLQVNWSCDCDRRQCEKELQLSDFESDDSDFELDDDFDMDSGSDEYEYSLEDVRQWLERKEEEGFNGTLPFLRKIEWTAAFSSNHFEAEYQLALYLIKNAVNLEKFICDPRYHVNWSHHEAMIFKDSYFEDVCRLRATKLAMVIPSSVDFTIL